MTPPPLLPPEIWDALPVEARALIQVMQLQVAEVPPIRPEGIEYQVRRLTCPGGGVTTRGPLPEGVPTGSFGPRLRALPSLLAAEFHLAKRPVPRLVRALLGLDVSLGMVAKLERQTASSIAPGSTYAAMGSFGDDAAGPCSVLVDHGDGTTPTSLTLDATGAIPLAHAYARPGT